MSSAAGIGEHDSGNLMSSQEGRQPRGRRLPMREQRIRLWRAEHPIPGLSFTYERKSKGW